MELPNECLPQRKKPVRRILIKRRRCSRVWLHLSTGGTSRRRVLRDPIKFRILTQFSLANLLLSLSRQTHLETNRFSTTAEPILKHKTTVSKNIYRMCDSVGKHYPDKQQTYNVAKFRQYSNTMDDSNSAAVNRAVVYNKPGTISTKIVHLEIPEPGPGEVLLRL